MDWYPWGEEAMERARRQDRPIFLSIGYSACHWCHVMEKESFQDPETADLLNRRFVSVKVDREERPDLDSVYMAAVQTMTGGGGWPLSVFLLPDGTPFYGGTYFPPEHKAGLYGIPAFRTVLLQVAEAFRSRREELVSAGGGLLQEIRRAESSWEGPSRPFTASLLQHAMEDMARRFDASCGGFGGPPKFPQPGVLEFLLRFFRRTGHGQALAMAEHTLMAMARGGIFDQLGGGFHRYATDRQWRVPHFEKMLYDNALLARVYTGIHQITGDPVHRRIAEATLDFLLREMRHPDGGFFSAQDADSLDPSGETREGAFFLWTPEEVEEVLGSDAGLFNRLFGVIPEGNFHGKSILHRPFSRHEEARIAGKDAPDLDRWIHARGKRLLACRNKRPKPFLDTKVLTSWNGMALRAFADAAAALGREDCLEVARDCAMFLLSALRRKDGRLMRVWKDGKVSVPGFLEDYAHLADGLLALHRAEGGDGLLEEARRLGDGMLSLFYDPGTETFYHTAFDHDTLPVRPSDPADQGTPSGISAAVETLLHLGEFTGEGTYRNAAEAALAKHVPLLRRMPLAFGHMLCAGEFLVSPVKRVTLEGDSEDSGYRSLLMTVLKGFRPEVLLSRKPSVSGGTALGRVCVRGACLPPVEEPHRLEALLDHGSGSRQVRGPDGTGERW